LTKAPVQISISDGDAELTQVKSADSAKEAPRRTPARLSAFDQLSSPYTKEQLTRLAESPRRDFRSGSPPYLIEDVRQHVADRPHG
jgi:hypothetical protein